MQITFVFNSGNAYQSLEYDIPRKRDSLFTNLGFQLKPRNHGSYHFRIFKVPASKISHLLQGNLYSFLSKHLVHKSGCMISSIRHEGVKEVYLAVSQSIPNFTYLLDKPIPFLKKHIYGWSFVSLCHTTWCHSMCISQTFVSPKLRSMGIGSTLYHQNLKFVLSNSFLRSNFSKDILLAPFRNGYSTLFKPFRNDKRLIRDIQKLIH